MQTGILVPTPPSFSFRNTLYSHGWSELPPFERVDDWKLRYVFDGSRGLKPVSATIREAKGGLRIDVDGSKFNEDRIVRDVRHILRLDDPLEEFYGMTDQDDRLSWVSSA